VARDPRKDRATKKRRRRRNRAWAERTAKERFPALLRRLHPIPTMPLHPAFALLAAKRHKARSEDAEDA
jgi:hypothetical protein